MNSNIHIDSEQKIKNFQEITNYFVGTKATLFAYSPGFRELYVYFEKNGRYFVLKFANITYVKTCKEWFFGGLKIEVETKGKRINSPRYYKIYDRNYFEVICPFFGVLEILDGQEIVNA
ncbi:hypothetical protein NIES4071_40810 [Calothrix sp. NIES-4071]|nr:hypothetical protein NIES4071_40810 [Calothrix sp. NIES-4071]BAZ58397.1 hypothetical protein NIES4105_40750 [Calothrix sp. NIES-4105]